MAEEKTPRTELVELGDSGLKRQGGLVYEEFLKDLKGTKANKAYTEMTNNDSVVGAVVYAIKMLILGTSWRVDAVSDETADQEAAEFLRSCMNDMEFTWAQTIESIMSFIEYGWSWSEIVFKRRLGNNPKDKSKNSRYNDGRIGWRKFAPRAQDTLYEWCFEDNGDIYAMKQQSPVTFRVIEIPLDRSMHFRTTIAKNNPEGKSLLRTAYRAWYMKKHIQNMEGIGIERDLAGLPVFKVPGSILSNSASEDEKQILAECKKIVKNIRRDEQEGLILPQVFDESGNSLYQFELLSTGSRRQFDTSAIIGRYDRDIAMSVLADFILLGHEKVGSFALSSSKTDVFTYSLLAILDNIQSVINSVAVPKLFAVNTFSVEELPKIVHDDIESVDLTELGNFITQMAGAGMELFPDDDLENWVRKQAAMPRKKEIL